VTVHDHTSPSPTRIQHLNDVRRLQSQLSEVELARLLALRGDEDVLDLGSGTGFYTDHIAALTTGRVYAVELLPEMNDHYRERGVPANVRLVLGDITALALQPANRADARFLAEESAELEPSSADIACTIATWHEIEGRLDLPGLAKILRPQGRLIVIDWRKDAESWESGPPLDERFSGAEVAESLAPYFTVTSLENVGRFMFAVTARRNEDN
jgi:SAM-dependent methyltransferase